MKNLKYSLKRPTQAQSFFSCLFLYFMGLLNPSEHFLGLLSQSDSV
jgi:hypothetical protein